MKKRLLIALAILVVAAAITVVIVDRALAPPPPLRAIATEFELVDVTVINPGHAPAANRRVVVGGGVIRSIDALAGAAAGAVPSQQYRGMFVLPGLIDMHAHLPPKNPLRLTSYFTLLNLAYGVTTLRVAADLDGTAAVAERDAARRGYPQPRTFTCDAFVSAGASKWRNTILLATPADADGAVARLAARGATCVKAYDGLTLPMVDALRVSAARRGLTLMGHVPASLSYEQALLPDVQHLMGIAPLAAGRHLYLSDGWDEVDDARLDFIVRVTKENALANTPTLVLGEQLLELGRYDEARNEPVAKLMPRLFRDVVWNPVEGIPTYRDMTAADFGRLRIAQQRKLRLVRLLHEAGTSLYLGTDTQQPFVVPGKSLQQEMELFVRAGIPLGEVWEMATVRSGEALRVSRLGVIAPGAPADLLVFRRDPTLDVSALDSLEAVISQGRLYTRASIDAKLAEYRAHFESPIFDHLSVVLARLALRKSAADP